jgi:hypothetical protein
MIVAVLVASVLLLAGITTIGGHSSSNIQGKLGTRCLK